MPNNSCRAPEVRAELEREEALDLEQEITIPADVLIESNRTLHRRCQKAEGELIKAKRALAWHKSRADSLDRSNVYRIGQLHALRKLYNTLEGVIRGEQ